ncbi:response regulator transcription factor [Paenibacillus aestuarii]|uniref:Response regulator transcription factor n=1 Tax=Paenibacillus aestuarii TaxID=516965 RepID=A0ABW0K6P0_9BACL|nr:response regulator transcription factor [Paenibacillus aestuarii]
MKARILVIEEDEITREVIEQNLSSQEYHVTTASDDKEGLRLWRQGNYDLIISGIQIPGFTGYELARTLRQESSVPIILLSPLSEEHFILEVFNSGADDYMVKPFSVQILVKRVEVLLRRSRAMADPDNSRVKFNELRLDVNAFKVFVGETAVELTSKEFEILKLLVGQAGHVVTREQILDKLWGYEYYGNARIIDSHLKNIRRKTRIPYIKTIKGIGYKLEL